MRRFIPFIILGVMSLGAGTAAAGALLTQPHYVQATGPAVECGKTTTTNVTFHVTSAVADALKTGTIHAYYLPGIGAYTFGPTGSNCTPGETGGNAKLTAGTTTAVESQQIVVSATQFLGNYAALDGCYISAAGLDAYTNLVEVQPQTYLPASEACKIGHQVHIYRREANAVFVNNSSPGISLKAALRYATRTDGVPSALYVQCVARTTYAGSISCDDYIQSILAASPTAKP